MENRVLDHLVHVLADYITRPTKERKRGQLAGDVIDVKGLLMDFLDRCRGERKMEPATDAGGLLRAISEQIDRDVRLQATSWARLTFRVQDLEMKVAKLEAGGAT